jgi:hypothetical protein
MQVQRRPSGLPDWLYVAIVAALGLYFVIGGIALTTFIYNGTPVPDSFTTILATIAGGLVGVLAPTGGQARPSPPARNNGHRGSDSRRTSRVVKHRPPEAPATGRVRSPPVHSGYTRSQQVAACNGHERSPRAKKSQVRLPTPPPPGTTSGGGPEFESPHQLPRGPHRALAHERLLTRDGPHPAVELGASPSGESVVVLAGRATRVP